MLIAVRPGSAKVWSTPLRRALVDDWLPLQKCLDKPLVTALGSIVTLVISGRNYVGPILGATFNYVRC